MRLDQVITIGAIVTSSAGAVVGRVRHIYIDAQHEAYYVLEDPNNGRVWLFQGQPVMARHFSLFDQEERLTKG